MFYENNIQVVDNYLAHKKYDGLNAFFQSSRLSAWFRNQISKHDRSDHSSDHSRHTKSGMDQQQRPNQLDDDFQNKVPCQMWKVIHALH